MPIDRKIITQKLKHPRTKEWIETMYIKQIEGAQQNNEPRIYLRGSLIDTGSVSSSNLQERCINTVHLENSIVTTNKLNWNSILEVQNIAGNDNALCISTTM